MSVESLQLFNKWAALVPDVKTTADAKLLISRAAEELTREQMSGFRNLVAEHLATEERK